jgi:hypothetical protein
VVFQVLREFLNDGNFAGRLKLQAGNSVTDFVLPVSTVDPQLVLNYES